jgi:Trp operon repressor
VNGLVDDQYNERYAQIVANKIQNRFEKDEIVQVTENMLDKKNKQELLDLMNALFEEHANALRIHLVELMKQKH